MPTVFTRVCCCCTAPKAEAPSFALIKPGDEHWKRCVKSAVFSPTKGVQPPFLNASSFRPSILDVRIQRRDTFGFTQGGLTQSKEQSSGLRRIYISWTAFDWESSPNPRPNTYTASMKIKLTQEFFELQVISLGFWRLHVSLNTDLRSQSNDPRSVKGKLKLFFLLFNRYYCNNNRVHVVAKCPDWCGCRCKLACSNVSRFLYVTH